MLGKIFLFFPMARHSSSQRLTPLHSSESQQDSHRDQEDAAQDDSEAPLYVVHSSIVWSGENDELISFIGLYWDEFESYC